MSLSADTGYFWFTSASNVEVIIKVLDARTFNNHFWVFYGALSNLQYTLTITDTVTGTVKTYNNPLGRFGSVGGYVGDSRTVILAGLKARTAGIGLPAPAGGLCCRARRRSR